MIAKEQLETGQFVYDFSDDIAGVTPLTQEWNDTVLDHFVSSELKMMVNGSWMTLDIAEKVIESDPDTDTPYLSHVWSAYSANGTVSSSVIYINSSLELELTVETDLRSDDVTQNVYGVFEAAVFPEQFVMMGAHRDSWVCGAQDDVSGTVTLLEVARGLSALYVRGWRPKRSLVFASWDSEESGLIGSTKLGEALDWSGLGLDEGLFAYLNLDMTTGGDEFWVAGHPLLARVSREAMRATPLKNARVLSAHNFSDHTVLAFHVGVAAMDLGFAGEAAFGAYHSAYDTNGWQQVVDADWMLAEDIARYAGVLALKLADAAVLPLDVNELAAAVDEYASQGQCDHWPAANGTEQLAMLNALSDFAGAAFEVSTLIANVANRTDEDLDDTDLEAVMTTFSTLEVAENAVPEAVKRSFHSVFACVFFYILFSNFRNQIGRN